MAETEKKRGALLTIWLILMLLYHGYPIILGFMFINLWVIISPILILSNLSLVFTIFLFMWKKWAFFAYCVTAFFIYCQSAVIGFTQGSILKGNILAAIFGPLPYLSIPLILYLIMRPKWDLFE